MTDEHGLSGDPVATQASIRPAATAVRGDDGTKLSFAALDRRANRLARALAGLEVGPGDRVAILCCGHDRPDLAVASLAASRVGASAIVLPHDLPSPELADALRRTDARLVLACAEGVEAWRATGVPATVVGDDAGVVWWKALELRQSPAPFRADRGAAATA